MDEKRNLENTLVFQAGIIHGLTMAAGVTNPLMLSALIAREQEKLALLKKKDESNGN